MKRFSTWSACVLFSVSSPYWFYHRGESTLMESSGTPAHSWKSKSIAPVNKCNLSLQTAVSFLQSPPRHTRTDLCSKTSAVFITIAKKWLLPCCSQLTLSSDQSHKCFHPQSLNNPAVRCHHRFWKYSTYWSRHWKWTSALAIITIQCVRNHFDITDFQAEMWFYWELFIINIFSEKKVILYWWHALTFN